MIKNKDDGDPLIQADVIQDIPISSRLYATMSLEQEDKKCYFSDENDPLGQVHVAEKYKKLLLEYSAMRLIALSDAGIPLEVLRKIEPEDIGWEEARSSASTDYAFALREAKKRITDSLNPDFVREESIILSTSEIMRRQSSK